MARQARAHDRPPEATPDRAWTLSAVGRGVVVAGTARRDVGDRWEGRMKNTFALPGGGVRTPLRKPIFVCTHLDFLKLPQSYQLFGSSQQKNFSSKNAATFGRVRSPPICGE